MAMPVQVSFYERALVIHAAGGVLLLSIITATSVLKPWGELRFGSSSPLADQVSPGLLQPDSASASTLHRIALMLIVAVALLLLTLHLLAGHFLRH